MPAVKVSVKYVQATAERTGLDGSSADVVTAGQCWHWFEQPLAIKEALRLLMRSGKLVIAHFDWLPFDGNMVAATERLIETHNPRWKMGGGQGVYPQWLPGLSEAGLKAIETFSYDIDVPYTPQAWRCRIRASAGVAAARYRQRIFRILTTLWPRCSRRDTRPGCWRCRTGFLQSLRSMAADQAMPRFTARDR